MITQEQLPMVLIPSMNDTHLEEMIIINSLQTALKNNDEEKVSQILKELLEHTTIHFFKEEEMMEGAQFPDLQSHKSEHDRHIQELISTVKYFEKHKDIRAIYAYIEGSLIPWMIHHIKTTDTVTAEFLNREL